MKQTALYFLLSISVLLTGCNRGKIKNSLLPAVSGSPGEVIVVMEPSFWKTSSGEAIKFLLMEDTPGLPQSEPLFTTVNIAPKAFTELFRIHRNILITSISSSVKKRGITVEYDKWARPQTIITLIAPTRESFDSLFNENNQKILGLLLKAERDRLTANYADYPEIKLIKQLEKNTGVHLTIPKGYSYDMDTTGFHWIALETPEISQGIFVYYYDYTDKETFTSTYLIKKRDEFLKQFVHGTRPDSYMTTELQVFPTFRSYELQGNYTAELRGLWKMEGDFMGGPFISFTQLDKKNNRVVTVEGFVYAPKFNKRNYVRQLEAILYTLSFVEPEKK
ncbi:MAG: DUF4837 family protein [Salinivirgaceae bacterium]